MNRKDQKLLSNLYIENINQLGAKTASSEEMAGMLAKHPDANKSMETTFSFEAPAGYEVDYNGSTLTIKRTVGNIPSTTMIEIGKKSVDEVQRHVDNQVAFDEYMNSRTPESKQRFLGKQKDIYSKTK